MVTGTLPALLFARDASNALRSAGHSSDKPARTVFRAALISLEIALAVALTASAGLTVRSFVALTHTDVGFNGAHLYDAYFGFLPSARYTTEASRHTFAQRLRNQIAKVPGVAVASVTNGAPFADENETNVHVPGRPDSPDQIDLYTVDGKFFKVMQLPILRGRAIQSADTDHSMPAIVVNAALAKRYFGTLDVVGKVIVPGMCAEGQKRCPRTIVGVVGDTRDSFAAAPVPTAFVPLPQLPRVSHVLIRVADDATLQAASIARAFTNTDPLVAPPNITPFSDLFREDAIRYETASLCFMIFAFVALVLALAGVYAVTAFSVTARTREFGIRKAIGATDGSVLLNVALHTLTQAAVGGALGLTIVAACGHLLEGLLYRIPAVDVQTFAGVLVLIAGCSVLAALGPAIRATRTSPALALRYE
jgi:putative ABC transport system permease protein